MTIHPETQELPRTADGVAADSGRGASPRAATPAPRQQATLNALGLLTYANGSGLVPDADYGHVDTDPAASEQTA
jgi:hypothetical protein